jgi:hypothetical protein
MKDILHIGYTISEDVYDMYCMLSDSEAPFSYNDVDRQSFPGGEMGPIW